MFMFLAICATCACHLVIFSEESLFIDAIIIGRPNSSISLEEYLIVCDETTFKLTGFLKVGQVSESSECKAKPRRTRYLTSLLVSGKFCVCFTQICRGRI